jgi:hypothetical protein
MSVTQNAKTLAAEATLAASALFSPISPFVIGTAGVVATATIVAPAANAQTQTTFKVDGASWTVTEYPTPALPSKVAKLITSHTAMISGILSGQQAMAMIRVSDLANNKNEITAIISPPGGIVPDGTPQGKDYRPLIGQVWDAYLRQKNQAAPANTASAGGPADPNNAEAPKVQAVDIAAPVQNRGTGGTIAPAAGGQREVKSLTNDSITVYDPTLKTDVTFTQSLMNATYTVTPKVPAGMPISARPESFHVYFEGGDEEAGAGKRALKAIKGTLTGAADSLNHRANAASSITTKTDVWRIKETVGHTTQSVYESGGTRVGGQTVEGRDPEASVALRILGAIKEDLDFAKAEILKAQQDGNAANFDLKSDRFVRGTQALTSALN